MKRSDMVIAGAERLFQTENAVDIALTESSEMLATLLRMRMASGMSAVVGQDAVESILSGTAALVKARRDFITLHSQLDVVKTNMGCATVAVGAGDSKPGTGSGDKVIPTQGRTEIQPAA